MKRPLTLVTVLMIALSSCGGGGGEGTVENLNLPTSNSETDSSDVKTGTAYAYDSALTKGMFAIQTIDNNNQIRNTGDRNYTFALNTNGMASIKIDWNKFETDFNNPDFGIYSLYVRLCADGVDSEGNIYFGAEVSVRMDDYEQETGRFGMVYDDALCVLIPYGNFDIENNSYFANPYTDFADYLYNYGNLSATEINNLISKVNENLGITYKDVAYDVADAESYINELKNALNIKYGKTWEWKAQLYKAFADADPTLTATTEYQFSGMFVKPTPIDSPAVEKALDNCVVTYWNKDTNQFETASITCLKLDNDYAVEIDSTGDIYGLLVNTGRTDSYGNPTYYEVAFGSFSTYPAYSLISYAYGIPQDPKLLDYYNHGCYDPATGEIVEINNPQVVNCYIDSNNHEIVCQFKATISTSPSTEQGNYPTCTILNAGMNGETIYAQGYLELSKVKRNSYYGEDVFATYYDEIFVE